MTSLQTLLSQCSQHNPILRTSSKFSWWYMTVFSQLAVAVSSGNWFSWWEEVQFSGCYKYHQYLQSPAMLLWQKLLKVFSLNSKSFGQPWQHSENIKFVLMFVRNNLGKSSPCSGGSSDLWTRWAATHRSDSGVLSSCGPHYALPPSPVCLSCSCCICVPVVCVLRAVGVSRSTWGGSWGRHRGGLAHTGGLPCCRLTVSALVGAKLLHPASVNCDCKWFLFLSYVSWCYGIFIPLVTKPNNDVFIVTDEFLWTMQWFILKPLLFSDMELSAF